MHLYHDSQCLLCRSPLGAAPCGARVRLRLRAAEPIQSALLRFYDGSEKWIPMEKEPDGWYAAVAVMPEIPILCWYDFRVADTDGHVIAYGGPADGMGGEGLETDCPRAWQITVYDPGYKTPAFMREGVMYQIFPDRFYRSGAAHPRREEIVYHEDWQDTPLLIPEGKDDNCARDFFGGDLQGIREKLPYLQALGVTVLYLNPVFMARSNHRYDTADYTRIDPLLGDNGDFAALCRDAKAAGIRVVLDGVFSHTGEDSVYFNRLGRFPVVGACQSTQSPYYPWYTFTRYPDEYKCWWNFHTLPEVNKTDPGYQAFILGKDGVARSWVRQGSAGWRLDVADELPMDFLRKLRAAVKAENPDALVLGEVWEDASHKVAYGEMRCYCQGDTLDSVMNYPLRAAAIDFFTGRADAFALCRLIRSQQENYPAPFYYSLMNLTGSHDRPRSINALCGRTWEELPQPQRGPMRLTAEEYASGKARYVAMLRLLCALPGIPCVYYGDEAGLQGASDPFCRGTFPWGKEDAALQSQVRALLQARRQSPALQTGTLEVTAVDADTLCIVREIRDGRDVFGKPAANERVQIEIRRTI